MTKRPQQARRAVLRVMYAADVSGISVGDALESSRLTLDDLDGAFDWDFVAQRLSSVAEKRDEIDAEIRRLSPNWRLDRMAAVDRNLLRLGIFEILEDVTPPLIAINACVELAKEFGTASTPGFINGLLDQLCQDHDIPIESTDSESPPGRGR